MKIRHRQSHSSQRSPKWNASAFVLGSILCSLTAVPAIMFAQDSMGLSQTSRTSPGYRGASVTMDYEGFTAPKYSILVAATEIGRLDQVSVEIGDRVKAGDVIAKLEDGLQKEAVATAQWRAQMRGETNAARAETALMKIKLDQLQTLENQRITRPDELKRAIADWEIAKSRELAATEQDQLRTLELSRYQLQLERRKVLAPMDGVVAELFHAPGEYITPADPAVIRLVVLDQLYGVFNVPVDEMGKVQLQDRVAVFLMSVSKSVTGTVASIAPDIDGESGTVKVKVLLDNHDGQLRSGDRCRMQPARTRTTLRVPQRMAPRNASIRIGEYRQEEVSGVR